MVAYGRDNTAICEELGCDHIIFQTLDGLINTCAEAARSQDLDEPQSFEVGFFCGQYASPVPPDSLDHLEKTRGNLQPLKDSDAAPQLVA
jgi:amidophosphoribosyltransferase